MVIYITWCQFIEILLPVHPPPLPFRGEKKGKKNKIQGPARSRNQKLITRPGTKTKKKKREKKETEEGFTDEKNERKRRRGIKDGPGRIVVCVLL